MTNFTFTTVVPQLNYGGVNLQIMLIVTDGSSTIQSFDYQAALPGGSTAYTYKLNHADGTTSADRDLLAAGTQLLTGVHSVNDAIKAGAQVDNPPGYEHVDLTADAKAVVAMTVYDASGAAMGSIDLSAYAKDATVTPTPPATNQSTTSGTFVLAHHITFTGNGRIPNDQATQDKVMTTTATTADVGQ